MMSETNKIVAQDLTVLEAMVADIGRYMISDATHWPMSQEGMPKLTIGGCLMRQERLQALRPQLAFSDQARLDGAIDAFNDCLNEQVVRFEKKAHDELHTRLREWTTFLRNATSKIATKKRHYVDVVDTRIVMTALINKLSQAPYRLNPQIVQDVEQMDNRLKGQWQTAQFILDPVWEKAYPSDVYWWLYGWPRQSVR
jgi:hypothetical protein